MNRSTVLALTGAMTLLLSACGGNTPPKSVAKTPRTTTTTTTTPAAEEKTGPAAEHPAVRRVMEGEQRADAADAAGDMGGPATAASGDDAQPAEDAPTSTNEETGSADNNNAT